MTSPHERLTGAGKPLAAEPPDAKEFEGLKHSGLARLKDAAARDGDGLRVSVDRVLDEFGDRLERITLGERDDADGVPVVADLQPTALIGSRSRL